MSKTNNNVFQRVEKKYLLDEKTYEKLLESISDYMKADEHGYHTICNLYYDTESSELIRTSIEKPVYKEKLRLRSYGIPNKDSTVYVEIKKKYKGIVYKRRVGMSLEEAEGFLNQGIKPEKDSQILREIDYFLSYYHPEPKLYLAYDRVAYVGIEDENLRVTFDRNIRSRFCDLELEAGDAGELLMDSSKCLMEVKVPSALPMWMVSIFSDLKIYPTSFSKYGNIYKNNLLTQRENDVVVLPCRNADEIEFLNQRRNKWCLQAY